MEEETESESAAQVRRKESKAKDDTRQDRTQGSGSKLEMKDTRESRRVSGGQRRGEGRPQGKGQGAQCPKKSGVGESRVRRWSVACRRVVACGCGSAHRGGAVGWGGCQKRVSVKKAVRGRSSAEDQGRGRRAAVGATSCSSRRQLA